MARDSRADRDATRQQVQAAARNCFAAVGVRKTTMEDVARRADVSRQTLYKHFAGRRELVEAAGGARIAELADDILARDWGDAGPAEVFLDRCQAIVASIRNDTELGLLISEGPLTLHEILWQPEVWLRGLTDWTGWLRSARSDGLVSGELTDEDLYDWMQTVLTSIILQPTTDDGRVRRQLHLMLRSFRPVAAHESE
ncbi:TetR/AcrR family transcriptional regulator [Actinomycetospora endophytica]|uniref:TetR/AcrR family transcriptional regulator n=1 Tax=Actinomycetospora endophytica TaxID=2291215 RepID=A0ABS8P8I3_9PSEU|nr:TetR/AcrR family transcriptional regulator [Actinomycetospora endophytica]MCD2194558.1 TetR/AcrR family transcriptional regulator [Actinomycetospora endophytica]